MPRKPDVLCAGTCGQLIWVGRGSLPPGQAMCRPCRAARPKPAAKSGYKPRPDRHGQCATCNATFKIRGRSQQFCSATCREEHPDYLARRRSQYRAKNYRRRAARRTLDVDQAYERELRSKAKRCPMPDCGVKLTDEPFAVNSKELDHIVPINVGGTHTIGNVRIICRECNQRRPKDGSDYVGPVTLWAEEPGVATRQRRPIKPRCACGSPLIDDRCRVCDPRPRRPARPEEGRRAATLRASGMRWVDVAEATGLRGSGSAYLCALKYGDPSDIARWPGKHGVGNAA